MVSGPHRDTAAHMVSRVQVSYLPVGTKHHFLELTQTLSLLQKDLRDQVVRQMVGATVTCGPSVLSPLVPALLHPWVP